MASTATPPTPAPPAAAAPAAAAPSPAPSPAPAAPAAAPPVAPPAAAPAPASAGEGGAPPVTPAAPSGPPKATDFPSTAEGVEQFIEAQERYRQDHPEETAPAAEATSPLPEPEGQKPPEPPKAEEPAKPESQTPAPASVATPQAMEQLLGRNPALKAALDANPADREVLMETARAAEAGRAVLELVPTVEDARFAVENQNKFLGLQHKFAMAEEMPEVGEQGFQEFLEMFQVVDDQGKPVIENGSPVMAPSFSFLSQKLTSGALSGRIQEMKATKEALESKLNSFVYPSEEAKEADRVQAVDADYAVKALEYAVTLLQDGEGGDGLPALPDDATPAQKEYHQQLLKREEELNKTRQTQGREQRVAQRKAFEREMNASFGAGIGEYVENDLRDRRARGEFIPDFLIEKKHIDPVTRQETKFPAYAVEIMNAFNAKIYSIPTVANKLRDYEMQGPAARQARLDYFAQLRKDHLPKIINSYWEKVHQGLRGSSQAQAQAQQTLHQVARVEPSTQGTPGTPAPLTGDALDQQVEANLKDNPEYLAASRVERSEMFIMERERIRSARR